MSECPICYDPLYVRGDASYYGACGHAFHVKCLNASVEAGNKSSCPMCNTSWDVDRVIVINKDQEQNTPQLDQWRFETELDRMHLTVYYGTKIAFNILAFVVFFIQTGITIPIKEDTSFWQASFTMYFIICFYGGFFFQAVTLFPRHIQENKTPTYITSMAFNVAAMIHLISARTSSPVVTRPLVMHICLCWWCKLVSYSLSYLWIIYNVRFPQQLVELVCCFTIALSTVFMQFDVLFGLGIFPIFLGMMLEEFLVHRRRIVFTPKVHACMDALTCVIGTCTGMVGSCLYIAA